MVAIGLMAVISAGVMSVIGQGPRQYARDSRKKADLESIRSALEMYRNDLGYYPAAASCANASCLATTYIQAVPIPPTGGNYGYATAGSCGAGACTYSLTATLEKITDPDYPTYTLRNP
jgi:general secretion pathway protein G